MVRRYRCKVKSKMSLQKDLIGSPKDGVQHIEIKDRPRIKYGRFAKSGRQMRPSDGAARLSIGEN